MSITQEAAMDTLFPSVGWATQRAQPNDIGTIVNRFLGGWFGTTGMICLFVLSAIAAWKHKGTWRTKGAHSDLTAGLKLGKVVWDAIEPQLRTLKPEFKEQFYWVDQMLDWIQAFIDRREFTYWFSKL